MTTFVTADIHLNANLRDAYRHRWMEGLPALLKKEQADRLILLGDLTSDKDHHGAWLTNKIATYMDSCAAICSVYILQGNHDWLLNANNPFFEFLGRYDRVRWIKDITALNLKGLGRCLFIPHQRKPEAWRDMAELKKEWSWVFTHNTFKGARNEQDMEMEGVPTGAILGHRVVSGDVHVPQKLGPVTYVGPPFTVNFGDSYQPRVLLLTEYGMNQRLCEGPRKMLVEADSLERVRKVKVKPEDIVKVRYEVAAQDYDKWPQIRKQIEEWAKRAEVVLDSVLPIPRAADEAVSEAPARSTVPNTSSDEDVMKAYSERYRVGDKTLRLGLKLMEKAG